MAPRAGRTCAWVALSLLLNKPQQFIVVIFERPVTLLKTVTYMRLHVACRNTQVVFKLESPSALALQTLKA